MANLLHMKDEGKRFWASVVGTVGRSDLGFRGGMHERASILGNEYVAVPGRRIKVTVRMAYWWNVKQERRIRVLLADDHAILREGLRALLGYYDDVQVVGEAQDGAEAVTRVGELQPDIVLMDIAMPGMSGLEATRLIRQQHPETRVLILTQHEDRQYVLPLLQAGASGYVLKRALGVALFISVKTVEWHRTNLMSKLRVHNVADLVRYAVQQGLVEEND